jgi:hypothetical protein
MKATAIPEAALHWKHAFSVSGKARGTRDVSAQVAMVEEFTVATILPLDEETLCTLPPATCAWML